MQASKIWIFLRLEVSWKLYLYKETRTFKWLVIKQILLIFVKFCTKGYTQTHSYLHITILMLRRYKTKCMCLTYNGNIYRSRCDCQWFVVSARVGDSALVRAAIFTRDPSRWDTEVKNCPGNSSCTPFCCGL